MKMSKILWPGYNIHPKCLLLSSDPTVAVLYQVPQSTVNKLRNEQVTSVQRPLS